MAATPPNLCDKGHSSWLEMFTGGRLRLHTRRRVFVMQGMPNAMPSFPTIKTNAVRVWTQTLQHWWRARHDSSGLPHVGKILEKKSLSSVFQPMVELGSGAVFGHEALVRVPRSLGELSFDNLLGAAQEQRCQKQLELACVEYAIERWVAERPKGQLYVNISAKTLVQLHESGATDSLLQLLRKHKLQPKHMGLDITGYTRIENVDSLVAALVSLRAAGMSIALDDFKASDSSMLVWKKVLPTLVKMAPRWTQGIDGNMESCSVVSSLVRMTKKHDCLLLAKSVESEAELRVMRQLGVDLAQGYFLGSPAADTITTVNLRARAVLGAEAH